jgi:mycothiol system anti-sigma-R factor
MSCGKPHETDCAEILDRVYLFLDRELDAPGSYAVVEQHLEECAPCLRKYDLERLVRVLVKRSCAAEHAPAELRQRVLSRIQQVRVEIVDTVDTVDTVER